jgi:hypothetical protein
LKRVETYGKEDNEAGYAEINPLHLLQPIGRIADVLEEDIGCQQGSCHGAYPLNGLCQVETIL